MPKEDVQGKKNKKTMKDEYLKKFRDKPKGPDDFDDDYSFINYAVALFDSDLDFDKDNRDQAIEDTKFMVGEQWDQDVIQERSLLKKPSMVFNRLPAFVAQLVGNNRLNETDIKVIPDNDGGKDIAKLREGLIRSIQKNSKARNAFNKAFENQVISGMGNFALDLDYAYDDVFEQDIHIRKISNSFSVVWDQMSEDPTGADANHVFEVETLKRVVFKATYPKASVGDTLADQRALGYGISPGWIMEDNVRVIRFWRMRTKKALLALVRDADGTEDVEDVTDKPFSEIEDRLVVDTNGIPVMREKDIKYAQLYILTALDILEGPYDLPINRVPLFRVPGWDINVGDQTYRFGLIRFLKDPQRLHNYWRSVIAEKLMSSPKGNWIATDEAVEGREEEWRNSHLSADPLLIYNQEAGIAPVRVPPAQVEPALIEQAGMAAQDLRDISNLHEASLGQKSNEVSGKAILARQRVGETGTVIYQDNLELAQEACGNVINQLIPHVYDTVRTIKILGPDGEDLPPQLINDETDEKSIDITIGKYTITSSTGPSTVTKRAEAAEGMLNMVNAMPQTMAVSADLIVEAQDWPNASVIAKRLKSQLPPGLVSQDEMSDEEKKAAAQAAAAQQEENAKKDRILVSQVRETDAKAEKAEADAVKARADAALAISRITTEEMKAIADIEDKDVRRVMDIIRQYNEFSPEIDIEPEQEENTNGGQQ